jgi:hypothetical protein
LIGPITTFSKQLFPQREYLHKRNKNFSFTNGKYPDCQTMANNRVEMDIGNNNPLSMPNYNVHFYIRINLENSGSARQKSTFLAPFSARRETRTLHACSRKFNWSVHPTLWPLHPKLSQCC